MFQNIYILIQYIIQELEIINNNLNLPQDIYEKLIKYANKYQPI